jgi:anthranilate synthase component 1
MGGAVGFLAYEAAGEFEHLPAPGSAAADEQPTSRFLRVDRLIVFDNLRHTAKIIVCTRPGEAASPADAYELGRLEIERIEKRLGLPPDPIPHTDGGPVSFESNMKQEQFCGMVQRARDYIYSGDAIQVVLSQRFQAKIPVEPFHVYRALRLLNPSPYTFFLKMGDLTLAGSSPEVLVRLSGTEVALRPIAGSRPRGGTEAEDRQLADDLLSDEKERAEHMMLVDLGRNDLGRVSTAGSVQVTELMTIERYSHVMHLVSHVTGQIRRDCDALDVIRAAFPAGTLTGAPKIRAMEIIHELEPGPRNVYGGAVGYLGYDGNMDLAITIRTIEIRGDRVAVQAGAGVVFDSVPEREFQETGHKSRGMKRAVELAVRGLDLTEAEL